MDYKFISDHFKTLSVHLINPTKNQKAVLFENDETK